MCDIYNEKHLTFDLNKFVHHATKMLKQHNQKLSYRHTKRFVKGILNTEYFHANRNKYHNIIHTFEVLQMTTYLLTFVKKALTPTECTMLQVSALCHDYGHNGITNNDWDDDSIHEQKLRLNSVESIDFQEFDDYNYESYNELMHIEMTIESVLKYKKSLFGSYSERTIRSIISKLILSTDLRVHDRYFKEYITNGSKIGTMILILKLADVSHILRPFRVHLYWVYRIKGETNATQLDTDYISKDTLWFADAFVRPLLDVFTNQYPVAKCLIKQFQSNLEIWNNYKST